jgi:hypothetical protein
LGANYHHDRHVYLDSSATRAWPFIGKATESGGQQDIIPLLLVATLPVNRAKLVAKPGEDGFIEGRNPDFRAANGVVVEVPANDLREHRGPIG